MKQIDAQTIECITRFFSDKDWHCGGSIPDHELISQEKIDVAEHWLKQLNLPRDDSASKLVFLEGRLSGFGSKQTDASDIFASLIRGQVNKASAGAQNAIKSV